MIETSIPSTLFGLPLSLERAAAQDLVDALAALWERQMGHRTRPLEADLRSAGLADIFSPIKTGKTLRMFLDALPDPPPYPDSSLIRPPLVIGEWRDALVTVEGRVGLEIVRDLLSRDEADPIAIARDTVHGAGNLVYECYRDWSMRRLRDVIALRSGRSSVMGPPGMAFLLLLLVNRSVSPETAIRTLPNRAADQKRLDVAAGDIIEAYSNVINPDSPDESRKRKRDPRHFSFYGGYARSEARRRVSWALGPEDDSNYIRYDRVDDAAAFVVNELRRTRAPRGRSRALMAFDALVAAYRRALPTLAALEMAHENRAATGDLRRRLEEAIGQDEDDGRP